MGTEPAIQRPDGTFYRPRVISANAIADEDDVLCGVMVLGTHDVLRAKPLADQYAAWQLGTGYVAVDPLTGWWRDGFEGGRRRWVQDERRGRAGTWFREIVEQSAPVRAGTTPEDGSDDA